MKILDQKKWITLKPPPVRGIGVAYGAAPYRPLAGATVGQGAPLATLARV